jgi:hypothetical protein
MKKTLLILSSVFLFALAACEPIAQPNADAVQRQQQAALSSQSNSAVGMPAVPNFQEKRMMKTIIELRDTALSTITYTQDMNGNLHKLCDSVGYGLPYATQFTNPQRPIGENTNGHPLATLPQADPNGLFSPASADGTWVLCVNPATKKTMPLYIEPHIIVSPFELASK